MLYLAFLFTNYSNAQVLDPTQVYTTDNIVQQTTTSGYTPWVNGVYQDNLTCWTWGNPGYCGPNPIVRPGNNINFSFGYTDLYQVQAIASVLPNSGSGLRVNGFNFSFTAKNGNGWDNGQQDYLNAYVKFYGSDKSLVENYYYNLNYKFNWTNFYFSETFKTPYATKDLSNVQYGFIGGDSNYWAGPYGPEVTNVSLSLKYSVDTCAVDPMSSPSCPGYYDTITKLATPPPEPAIETPTTAIANTAPTITDISTAPVNTNTTVTTSTTPVATSTPTSQPAKAGEVQQSGSSKSSTVSLSSILNIVNNEKSRIGALENSVVQNAIDTAAKQADKAKSDAESVALTLATQATTAGSASGLLSTLNIGNPSLNQNQQNSSTVVTPQTSNLSTISFGNSSLQNKTDTVNVQQVDIPKTETLQLTGVSPIKDYLEEKPSPFQQETNKSSTTSTVNKTVQDNQLAGAASIQAMAIQPLGFNQYTIGLVDAQFYQSKEIYRNQRVIDNAKALRQLSSDRLHQELVELQYK